MSQCKNQSWATVHFQLPPCGMVMMDKLSLIVSVSFIKSMIKSLVSKAKGMRALSVMMLLSWVWYSSYTHLSNLHQKCKILALPVSNNKLIKWSNVMRKSEDHIIWCMKKSVCLMWASWFLHLMRKTFMNMKFFSWHDRIQDSVLMQFDFMMTGVVWQLLRDNITFD